MRQADQSELDEMKRMRQSDRAELEEVKRMRRSDANFMVELKQLIKSQIKKYRKEHSACTMGNYTTTEGATRRGFEVTETIQFEQEFEQIPNVIASIAAFDAGRLSAVADFE